MVKSPTYTLCEEYELDELLFLHIDLYRSGDAEDIDLFDIDRDIKKQKIILIEWPEKLFSERKPDVEIYLEHAKEMRKVSVKFSQIKIQMIYLKMYKKFLIMSLLAFQTVSANEIEFLEVKEKKDRFVEISFLLEKVSYVRSYSLTEPSRIVIEVEDSELASTGPMNFNFPIKKIIHSGRIN